MDSNNEEIMSNHYLLFQQLCHYNRNNDIQSYRNVFNDFILQPTIAGHFSFTVYSQPGSFLIYPLCSCDLKDTDLHKIHSTLHECKCYCQSGKIYIALRQAYEIAYCVAHKKTKCLSGWQIADFYRYNKMGDNIFFTNPIIKWIINTRCHFTRQLKSVLRLYIGWGEEENSYLGKKFIQTLPDSDSDSESDSDLNSDLHFYFDSNDNSSSSSSNDFNISD